jgi:hypothetical protein
MVVPRDTPRKTAVRLPVLRTVALEVSSTLHVTDGGPPQPETGVAVTATESATLTTIALGCTSYAKMQSFGPLSVSAHAARPMSPKEMAQM